MKRLLIAMSTVVVLSVVGLTAANLSNTGWADSPAVATQTNEQTQVFAIENMTCPACPFTVNKAMTRVAGVKSITVDFAAKTATAIFNPITTTVEDIANASTDVGYPATPIEGADREIAHE